MSFKERLNQQRRDSERSLQQFQEENRRRDKEKAVQERKDFEEWHARDLTPVWRNWERLEVTKKVEALRRKFPCQYFKLVILKTGVMTTPNAGSYYKEFSWGSADASNGHTRSQSRSFRSDDFTQDKVLVATSGAPTSLGAEINSELVGGGVSEDYSYISVKVDKEKIVIGGNETITLEAGVLVRQFDDALLKATAHPGRSRYRDPDH